MRCRRHYRRLYHNAGDSRPVVRRFSHPCRSRRGLLHRLGQRHLYLYPLSIPGLRSAGAARHQPAGEPRRVLQRRHGGPRIHGNEVELGRKAFRAGRPRRQDFDPHDSLPRKFGHAPHEPVTTEVWKRRRRLCGLEGFVITAIAIFLGRRFGLMAKVVDARGRFVCSNSCRSA